MIRTAAAKGNPGALGRNDVLEEEEEEKGDIRSCGHFNAHVHTHTRCSFREGGVGVDVGFSPARTVLEERQGDLGDRGPPR